MMPRCYRPCSIRYAEHLGPDTKGCGCHELIKRKGAKAGIPPRKNAGLWEEGYPRNEAVLVMCKEGLTH